MIDVGVHIQNMLTDNNIPFRIIGGLAVGYHSAPRTTADIDFMVRAQDQLAVKKLFNKTKPLSMEGFDGFTVQIKGTDVDFLIAEQDFLFDSKADYGFKDGSFVITDLFATLYLKLKAGRVKDSADIIAMVKGLDISKKNAFIKWLNNNVKDKQELSDLKEEFESLFIISELENKGQSKKAGFEYRKYLLNKLT